MGCIKTQNPGNLGTRHAHSVSLFVLTFPHSNVDVERVFSEVTPIKTKSQEQNSKTSSDDTKWIAQCFAKMYDSRSSSNKDYVVDLYLGKLSFFPVLGNLQILDLGTLARMHSMGSSDCSWTQTHSFQHSKAPVSRDTPCRVGLERQPAILPVCQASLPPSLHWPSW